VDVPVIQVAFVAAAVVEGSALIVKLTTWLAVQEASTVLVATT